MGYQLPGLGNVAFPGFGALGKQQTKKGKDQASPATPTSPSRSSSSTSVPLPPVAARSLCEGRLLERGFLQKWRMELRPLLNSLRFVEASNRESCKDGTSCIGPFQISRHYHHDAWKHTPPISWSRCRDLNHAENTVIAYWFKYCPEAVEKHDFETLAKIHKGASLSNSSWSQNISFTFEYVISPHELRSCGPQGLQKEEINYYWSKVSQHLKEQETAGSKKENKAWVFFSNENHAAKQEVLSRVHQKSSAVLSSINTNTMVLPNAQGPSYAKSPTSCVTPPKQQLPLIQTLKPKMFRRAVAAIEKKSKASFFSGVVKSGSRQPLEDIDYRSTNKRLRKSSYFHFNTRFEHGSLGHAFNLDFSHQSRADRMERAVINVQSIWRMRCVRRKYLQMRSAAVLIQKKWRKHHFLLLAKQRITQGINNAASSACTGVEEQQGYVRPIGSPCDLLYRTDISPNQEDELLSELVSLLNLDTQTPIEACHSFRFPYASEEISEACTPKMKPEMKVHFTESSNLSAQRHAHEPSCIALPFVENTPLAIKQALLSPLMEKEIIAELAKLFHPCKTQSLVDVSATLHCLVSSEDVSAKASMTKENVPNVLNEQCGKDGIMRRLKFTYAGDEEFFDNDEIASAMDVGCLEWHGEPCTTDCFLSSSLEDIWHGTSSSSFSGKVAEGDDEELKHIDIPLLVDQSPVLTSKRRVRNQNPCNQKVEKTLVSSLGEWQYSVSFDEESQDQETCRALKADVSVSAPTSFSCACTNSSQEDIFLDGDISWGVDESTSIQVSSSNHPDYLLETSDVKSSTVYAKAIFRCLNFSLDGYADVGGICEESQTKSGKMDSAGISSLSQTRLASLHHLCMLWDANNVDLLTRSLKFKALQAADCDHCRGGHSGADEARDIQMEITNLEKLPKKRKEESKKELVLHQRDIIYTNIAAYCNAQERQDLYDKWEIEKLLTGRLKKIVYELLWVDPQRCWESAELVIRYL